MGFNNVDDSKEGIARFLERNPNTSFVALDFYIYLSIGLSQGAYQKAVETAKNALTMNLSIEQVATLTGLSVEEIEKL